MLRSGGRGALAAVALVMGVALAVSAALPGEQVMAQEEPRPLWAGLSIAAPLWQPGAGPDGRPQLRSPGGEYFALRFAIVNEGGEPLAPGLDASRLIVNGAPRDIPFLWSGARDARWDELPPGHSLELARGLEDAFRAPGVYTVVWEGPRFRSAPVTFRVLPAAR